ncbi:MAG: DUF116 domain-containing protein [Candidatus Thorarchaeota archaeon]
MTEDDKVTKDIDLSGKDICCSIRDLLEHTSEANPLITPTELADTVIAELLLSEERLVNFTIIEAMNVLSGQAYTDIPLENKILLIPHCLRDAQNCIAPVDEEGYHCQKCGACVIADIVTSAEAVGIKWYMVGGGSQAMNIVKNARPHAVLGIACFDDSLKALETLGEYGIPSQAILLSKAGCVNTEVDLDLVIDQLNATNNCE